MNFFAADVADDELEDVEGADNCEVDGDDDVDDVAARIGGFDGPVEPLLVASIEPNDWTGRDSDFAT